MFPSLICDIFFLVNVKACHALINGIIWTMADKDCGLKKMLVMLKE